MSNLVKKEETGTDEMNIFQRINEVRKEVEYIQKDKKVQGYMTVTHDTVTSELRKFLVKFGIIIVPSYKSSSMIDTGTVSSGGAPALRYEAVYEIRFVNMDDPKDFLPIIVESHALDYGDKAPGKALSYATKYAMLKVFSIETGENEESRQELKPRQVEAISGEQVEILNNLIAESGSDKDGFLKFCKVNGISEITTIQFPQAVAVLEKKKKANADT